MIYTSGTTGQAKGVRRSAPTPDQNGAMEKMRALVYGITEGSRVLLPGPLYHSAQSFFAQRASQKSEVLVLMPRFSPERLLELIQEQIIEIAFMVPTMFVRLLKLPERIRGLPTPSCIVRSSVTSIANF